MAKKKSRVPVPPAAKSRGRTAAPPRRPVQAPKVRPKERRTIQRPTGWMYAAAAAGVLGIVAVVAVVLVTRGSNGGRPTNAQVAAAMQAAGCTYKTAKPLPFPSNHTEVPTLQSPVKWTTFPPGSGEHWRTPAIWGFYRTAINPRQVVHNEEHGGVILWWGPKTPAATVNKLETFYDQEPDSMFGTMLADSHPGITYLTGGPHALGSKVAITAWAIDHQPDYFKNGDRGYGVSAVCPTFNEKAFSTFRDAHRGYGPEFPQKYSLQINKPGH
jgi:Protein of unknown function (DUF3105)